MANRTRSPLWVMVQRICPEAPPCFVTNTKDTENRGPCLRAVLFRLRLLRTVTLGPFKKGMAEKGWQKVQKTGETTGNNEKAPYAESAVRG